MSLLQSFNELGSFFTEAYNNFISAIESSVEGLELARDTINEFDARIVTAVDGRPVRKVSAVSMTTALTVRCAVTVVHASAC